MNDEDALCVLILLIAVATLSLAFGFNGGYDTYKSDMCTAMYTKTANYAACLDKSIEDTIKQIKKVDTDNGQKK